MKNMVIRNITKRKRRSEDEQKEEIRNIYIGYTKVPW